MPSSTLQPPMPRLPSLAAVRAFEVAARCGSFALAAAELHVTAAAVAVQVKAFESWVGQPLFERLAQGVRLNAQGKDLLPLATEALQQWNAQLLRLHASVSADSSSALQVAALPALAQLVLMPRLSALQRDIPALRLSVVAMDSVPSFARQGFQLGLFYAAKPRAGAHSSTRVALASDHLLPVCTPVLAESLRGRAATALRGCTLLRDTTWRQDWPLWANSHGLRIGAGMPFNDFSLYSMAVQAALAGQGVLMGRMALVDALLRTGQLAAPWPYLTVALKDAPTVYLPATPMHPQALALARWLQVSH
jgi:LysR family glycine cleavage system transcriptional activator